MRDGILVRLLSVSFVWSLCKRKYIYVDAPRNVNREHFGRKRWRSCNWDFREPPWSLLVTSDLRLFRSWTTAEISSALTNPVSWTSLYKWCGVIVRVDRASLPEHSSSWCATFVLSTWREIQLGIVAPAVNESISGGMPCNRYNR